MPKGGVKVMESHVSVNGVIVPVITEMQSSKIRGLRYGSILVVSYNCEIPIRVKEYLDSKEIKTVRIDQFLKGL